MKKIKVLNLFCGIGGNRKLWENVDVTAVEYDPKIAAVYQEFFPEDNVVVGDAHQYLIDHVQDGWDFIWASPPCPSHSRINTDGQQKPRYPEMELYQEIIMLGNNWYKGKWCVENVIPYYKPLVGSRFCLDRHLFWANFDVTKIQPGKVTSIADQDGNERFGFSLRGRKGLSDKRKMLRNLVNPEVGLHIFESAMKIKPTKRHQKKLF